MSTLNPILEILANSPKTKNQINKFLGVAHGAPDKTAKAVLSRQRRNQNIYMCF
jgi:TusA-related sulfurtransferase